MRRFILFNPNTNAATTEMMLRIAREALGAGGTFQGVTAAAGAAVITEPEALVAAAVQVGRMAEREAGRNWAGGLVAAFGDPGLEVARARLGVAVTGLAEAAIREAATAGRRFAIVTTTPALDTALRERVAASGQGGVFAGLRYTRSGVAGMGDPERLYDELAEACALAVASDGAEAIVIGGGPLAAAARRLRQIVPVALIEPVPAAVRLMLERVLPEAAGRGIIGDDPRGGDIR